MKKVIFLLFSILFLSGCTNNILDKQVNNNDGAITIDNNITNKTLVSSYNSENKNIDYNSVRSEINNEYKNKIKDKIKISEIKEKNGNESLYVEIPTILDLEDTNKQNLINAKIYEFILDGIAEYKDIYNQACPNDIGCELFFTYDNYYLKDDIISVKFYYYFFTGGAHGMSYPYIFNFDLKNNKIIKLDDIFTGDYLNYISSYCYNYFKNSGGDKYIDDKWLKDGTSVKEENYSLFSIQKDAITFYFKKYQIAAYADGDSEVNVPIDDELLKYIKEEYKGYLVQ